jgi:hypothetical protein
MAFRRDGSTTLDKPFAIVASSLATAPVNGATPTGEIIVAFGGKELARTPIGGASTSVPVYVNAIGALAYEIKYSGDANFLPESVTGSLFVSKGRVTVAGSLQPQSTAETLTLRVIGAPSIAPTGTVVILNGTTELARVALVPAAGGTSTATVNLTGVSSGTLLTISYPGDAMYETGTQQLRVFGPRRRTSGH